MGRARRLVGAGPGVVRCGDYGVRLQVTVGLLLVVPFQLPRKPKVLDALGLMPPL